MRHHFVYLKITPTVVSYFIISKSDTKLLGLHLDSHLNSDNHVNSLVCELSRVTYLICKLKSYVNIVAYIILHFLPLLFNIWYNTVWEQQQFTKCLCLALMCFGY